MARFSSVTLSFALALLTLGCGDEAETIVDVYFEAGPDSTLRADHLSVTVTDREGRDVLVERYVLGDAGRTLPIGIRVRPLGDDAAASFSIRGELEGASAAFSIVSARIPFVAGESRELRLRFEDNCVDKLDCAAETTCLAGGCTSFCYAPTADGFVLTGCGETDGGTGPDAAGVDASMPDAGPAPDTGPPDAAVAPHLTEIAGGRGHTCVALHGGDLYCWGDNEQGQVGNGVSGMGEMVLSPNRVDGISNVVDIAAGAEHTCAITNTGDTYCWGQNCCNALGLGGGGPDVVTPALVIGADSAIQVVAGNQYTCIVRDSGTMFCWGSNNSGQLGKGGGGNSPSPTLVLTSDVVAAHAGSGHACALISNGTVQCWGSNDLAELGDGGVVPGVDTNAPGPVVGIDSAVEIGGGREHTCARLTNGTVTCWGRNWAGQLGRSATMSEWSTPMLADGLNGITAVALGQGYHACVIQSDGTLLCWGQNHRGQLGRATIGDSSRVATPVMNVMNVTGVELGWDFACAVEDGRDLYCWGNNEFGQLGIGTVSASIAVPLKVNGLPDP